MIQQPDNPELQGRAEGFILRTASWGFFALLFTTGLVLFLASCVTHWTGSKDVELRFLVVDAQTRAPIEGASVMLSRPGKDYGREVKTGPDGAASLTVSCWTACKSSFFEYSGSVMFWDWEINVSKDGYGSICKVELPYWKGGIRDIGDADPPPIRVELKRLPAAGEG
jgi:hypothetical protein